MCTYRELLTDEKKKYSLFMLHYKMNNFLFLYTKSVSCLFLKEIILLFPFLDWSSIIFSR